MLFFLKGLMTSEKEVFFVVFEHSASHKHKIQSSLQSFCNPLSATLIFCSFSPHQHFVAAALAFPKYSDLIKQFQQKIRNKTAKPLVKEAELHGCRTTLTWLRTI